jgi:hypothetical protein
MERQLKIKEYKRPKSGKNLFLSDAKQLISYSLRFGDVQHEKPKIFAFHG